jgi:isoleucyl-tRNA synthetase
VDPIEIGNRNGVEIIRLWSVYEDYGQDLSCGQTELDRVTETYRRIRNTMRFMLGSISDFDASKDAVPYTQMTEIDQWAMGRLYDLTERVTAAYNEYSFYKVYHALNQFFTVDLSATYLDILKDRLYTWKADGKPRRSSQTVLYTMTDYLVRLMAPVLSFLSEEVYGYIQAQDKKESVFLLDFPKAAPEWKDDKLAARFEQLLKVRTDVQKELELLRAQKTIGASLEGFVKISAEPELLATLQNFAGLREFLIVSEVHLDKGSYKVHAEKAAGDKCIRCWTYSTEIGKNPKLPGICPKCTEALT